MDIDRQKKNVRIGRIYVLIILFVLFGRMIMNGLATLVGHRVIFSVAFAGLLIIHWITSYYMLTLVIPPMVEFSSLSKDIHKSFILLLRFGVLFLAAELTLGTLFVMR